RYPRDLVSYGPTLPHNPDIEIQQAGGIGQARDHLALYWDAVLIDFIIEALAEGDDVLVSVGSWRGIRIGAVEPKLETIKEMKSRPVENLRGSLCCFRAEENCSCENTLEALDKTPVMETILRQ